VGCFAQIRWPNAHGEAQGEWYVAKIEGLVTDDAGVLLHMLKYDDKTVWKHNLAEFEFRVLDVSLPKEYNQVPRDFGQSLSKRAAMGTVEKVATGAKVTSPKKRKNATTLNKVEKMFPCPNCAAYFPTKATTNAHLRKRECFVRPPQPHGEIVGAIIKIYWQNAHGRNKGEWYLATVLEYNADELIHHLQYEDESCFWSPLAQFEWTMVNDAGATKSDAPAIIDTAQEDEQKPATRAGEVTVHVDKGHLSKKRKAANLKKPSATKSQKGEVSDLSATQGSIKEVKGLRDKGVCSSGVQSRQKKQAKKTKAR